MKKLNLPLFAVLSVLSYNANAKSLCDRHSYGEKIARCHVVARDFSSETGAFFRVDQADVCVSVIEHAGSCGSGKEIRWDTYYVNSTLAGEYRGSSPSKDGIFPGYGPSSKDPSGRTRSSGTYLPGDRFEEDLIVAAEHQTSGPTCRSVSGAETSESGLTLSASKEDGAGGHYASYRSEATYDSVRRSGTLTYSRKYGGVFGSWRKIVSFSFECE